MDYKNAEESEIFVSLRNKFKDLENSFKFLNIPSEEFKKIVIKEIVFLKKNNCDNKSFVKKLIDNVTNKLDVKLADMQKTDDGIYQVVDNFINTALSENSMNLFEKLYDFLTKYNIVINPDIVEKLLSNNKKILSATIDIFKKNEKNVLSGNANLIFDNLSLLLFLETYCMLNNTEIEKKEEPCYDELPSAHSNELIYYNDVKLFTVLSREEEYILANRMVNGDEEARDLFINSNLRLVLKIAKSYANCNLSYMDLVQEGNLGLIEAASRFDPLRGYRFSTYASNWINQKIRRAIAEKGHTIRMPYNVNEKIIKYLRAFDKLQNELCHEPSIEELAKETGFSVNVIKTIQEFNCDTLSLNTPLKEDDETELQDMLIGEDDTEKTVMQGSLLNQLQYQMKICLNEREIKILALRYGLNGRDPMTLEMVGKALDITRERVRQIEARALVKLRKSKGIGALANYTDDFDVSLENLKMLTSSDHILFSQNRIAACRRTVFKYLVGVNQISKESYLELLQKNEYNHLIENLDEQEVRILRLSCPKINMKPEEIASLMEIDVRYVYKTLKKFSVENIEKYLGKSMKLKIRK